MSTKDKLLAILEKNRGESLSGEELAALLGVSRAAVWKSVKALENDGYIICAATNRGYSLSQKNDILSVQGIEPYLSEAGSDNTHVYRELESTNKTAKEMALNGCEHGTVVIADCQTAGRGRRGRNFCSPPGNGLYISFVLHTGRLALPSVTAVTAVSAVAVCRAIKSVTGVEAGIKWVNDVIIDGKKACGILTEGITDLESGAVDWVVAGIGINIGMKGIPEELRDVAGAVFGNENDYAESMKKGSVRNRLAAELINTLLSEDIWKDFNKIRGEYKNRLVMLGKEVTVINTDEEYKATALDIDELCRLIVRLSDGSEAALSSGEVSVRIPSNGLRS